jgi:hypothetical protein
LVVFTSRCERLTAISPLNVGVFVDDALLLRLAARSVHAESDLLRTRGLTSSDSLALEVARQVESSAWVM